MRLYDAHNHLQDERLLDRADALLREAADEGIAHMVVNGATETDWPDVAALYERHPDHIIPSYGLHPWYVQQRSDQWEQRLCAALDAHPAGVGEMGLDRWKSDLSWEGQEEVFIAQLRIAAERNLPASIHCLQAWGRLYEILEQEPRPACGFLLHSYGGSAEMVERFAPLGAYFSFPGAFAREKKERQREAFRRVPPDRLLIETDAPDQHPPPRLITHPLKDNEGQALNHPANLAAVYRYVADMLDEPVEQLAARVETNFKRLFAAFS